MEELKIVEVSLSAGYLGYTISEACGWDLGRPIGCAESIEGAIIDFRNSWELKFNEEIDVLIIDKPNNLNK
jgi:hypothetical protein